MSMPKLNAPVEIHWRRSNMNTRDPILMKSVEVLKDCRSLNAAAEMNCPMPRSVEKVPIRNEKRCTICRLYDPSRTVVHYVIQVCTCRKRPPRFGTNMRVTKSMAMRRIEMKRCRFGVQNGVLLRNELNELKP